MSFSEPEKSPQPMESKRQFLKRQGLAVGAIVATALLARSRKALAGDCNSSDCHCFLRGTRIETVDGPRLVEDLAAGDVVSTMFGGTQSIQRVSHYTVKKEDPSKPWVKDVLPVRIARSALAPNVPRSDLYVSQGHALLIDGVLVPAGSLINRTTIALDASRGLDELEFFHVELTRHDVIYAEGAPVETLQKAEESPCLPILSFNGGRSQLRSRIRSALSPWYDRRTSLDRIRDRFEARRSVSLNWVDGNPSAHSAVRAIGAGSKSRLRKWI